MTLVTSPPDAQRKRQILIVTPNIPMRVTTSTLVSLILKKCRQKMNLSVTKMAVNILGTLRIGNPMVRAS